MSAAASAVIPADGRIRSEDLPGLGDYRLVALRRPDGDIVITGLPLAFGETSGGFRRLIQIVFGLSIAFAASSFFLSFFQFGGGALI